MAPPAAVFRHRQGPLKLLVLLDVNVRDAWPHSSSGSLQVVFRHPGVALDFASQQWCSAVRWVPCFAFAFASQRWCSAVRWVLCFAFAFASQQWCSAVRWVLCLALALASQQWCSAVR